MLTSGQSILDIYVPWTGCVYPINQMQLIQSCVESILSYMTVNLLLLCCGGEKFGILSN